jgi:hyperpolarization activated cyclic nucleotide-gated potassium channel 2
MFFSHLIACILHFIGDLQGPESSWLQHYQLIGSSWEVKYVHSLYWAIITTTTVGYGDITPQTSLEKGLLVVVTLFSSVVFGYMISSIGSIFSSLKEDSERYLNQMAAVNSFLKSRKVKPSLQLKARVYFEYYLRQIGEELQMQNLMTAITPELSEEIKIDLYLQYIRKLSLLKTALSEQTARKLCLVVKERKVQPEEVLLRRNE